MAENRLKESILNEEEFTITWELVPGRGARERNQEAIFEGAEKAAQDHRIHGITLTDNPGGNPAISAEYLGLKVREMGIEPLVHFTCKDKSRNQIESFLYSLAREEVHNLLVMTGDYPVSGYQGRSRPVFDLDPVHVVQLINEMNQGLKYKAFGRDFKLQPTEFFAGVAVSPFKQLESELLLQYFKLKKKIEAGAEFIIPQLGYDARKFHELIQFLRINELDIPVIGNVYVLPLGAAKFMNRNQIPGVVVTDELVKVLTRESDSPDKGKEARLMRAAKMYAFMKGMGFAGVHIGGHGMPFEDALFIIEKGEELSPNWRDYLHEFHFPMKDGFYYYERDEKTGLNSERPSIRLNPGRKDFHNSIFRVMHHALFEPGKFLFTPMSLFCRLIDNTFLERPFEAIERLAKTITNDCRECGDCALFDLAYLCPMSQCPKNQRNGACGGSRDGWCEVYPEEKKCIYIRVYDRLKAYDEEKDLENGIVPPVNWDFKNTSSWLNYFLGRDHSAKKVGIKPPKKKKAKF